MTHDFTALTVDTDDRGVRTITLNRPDVRNAFNEVLIAELHRAVEEAAGCVDVRALVLKGAGKAFSAGADLEWMKRAAEYTQDENFDDALKLAEMLDAFNSTPLPTIALVHGGAYGGGVGLVACTDIAIAVEGSTFGLTEVRLGLTPATISPHVVAAIGEREARRLMLTGTRFDAAEARRIGLVHEVAADDSAAEARVAFWTGEILASAPGAVAAAKHLIFTVRGRSADEDVRRETARQIADRRTSDEGREGIGAFLGKRQPSWFEGDD